METRAQKARSIAVELGVMMAGVTVINLVRKGWSEPLWMWLCAPMVSFVFFFTLAFLGAFAFPAMAERREYTEEERRRRFERVQPFLWPMFAIAFLLLLGLAVWLGGLLGRVV